MATKEFHTWYAAWEAWKRETGYTDAEIAEIKNYIRQDMNEGPDILREGLTHLEDGMVVDSVIPYADVRTRYWLDFFKSELELVLMRPVERLADLKGYEEAPKPSVDEALAILAGAKTDGWKEACMDYWTDKFGKGFTNSIKNRQAEKAKKGAKRGKK